MFYPLLKGSPVLSKDTDRNILSTSTDALHYTEMWLSRSVNEALHRLEYSSIVIRMKNSDRFKATLFLGCLCLLTGLTVDLVDKYLLFEQ